MIRKHTLFMKPLSNAHEIKECHEDEIISLGSILGTPPETNNNNILRSLV